MISTCKEGTGHRVSRETGRTGRGWLRKASPVSGEQDAGAKGPCRGMPGEDQERGQEAGQLWEQTQG